MGTVTGSIQDMICAAMPNTNVRATNRSYGDTFDLRYEMFWRVSGFVIAREWNVRRNPSELLGTQGDMANLALVLNRESHSFISGGTYVAHDDANTGHKWLD